MERVDLDIRHPSEHARVEPGSMSFSEIFERERLSFLVGVTVL